jgi:hypothetical protein
VKRPTGEGGGMSQCDLILEVLADGKPHSFREIHQHAGFCRMNSRVAELRAKRGLNIVCHKGGGDYRYQLLPAAPLVEATSEPCFPSIGGTEDASTSGVDPREPASLLGGAAQLSLLEVAA